MSKNGDVVFANGKSWQRDSDIIETTGDKNWWYSPVEQYEGELLFNLKGFADFRWLVKDGEVTPNYDDAVKEYEEIISTLEADIASKSDAFITAIALWKDEEVGWKQETDSLHQQIQKQRESIDAYQNEKEKCCVYNNCYEVEVIRDELKRISTNRDVLKRRCDTQEATIKSYQDTEDEKRLIVKYLRETWPVVASEIENGRHRE